MTTVNGKQNDIDLLMQQRS